MHNMGYAIPQAHNKQLHVIGSGMLRGLKTKVKMTNPRRFSEIAIIMHIAVTLHSRLYKLICVPLDTSILFTGDIAM